MGAAASIEGAQTLQIDYATLKSSSNIDFVEAYSALQDRLTKGQSEKVSSIPFLAIRQLSQNLRNQDRLERTKKKVLKSRSLPDNLKYKYSEDEFVEENDNQSGVAVVDELENADLDIITDHEYDPNHISLNKETKPVKKKPNLSLQVMEDKPENESIHDQSSSFQPFGGKPVKPASPSANVRVSPRGTLYLGKWKIMETGIFPDNNSADAGSPTASNPTYEAVRKQYIEGHGYVGEMDASGMYLWKRNMSQSCDSQTFEEPLLPALGGKRDFIEISTLGSGASGVVTEAIHVPSLTLVALKILPIYNHEKRQHVSRELTVLYKNLTEMRLINDSLQKEDQVSPSNSGGRSNCPNVLSLYNAFVDPRSGMINLVVEYMDGGSLEDLVKQGGCKDERVLADIAYQTLNGLHYLHSNKNVHRDIKPANILCSSVGVIKIADFGISKALDKTTGFANSFVGTVCYMSPERITGDSHSFPCDIWSLGLTILAVSRGRFPISMRNTDFGDDNDESDMASSPKIIGGAGGYWAMIKAICDDDPPEAGPSFSDSFNFFIRCCLQKQPGNRLTASQLIESDFVTYYQSLSSGSNNDRDYADDLRDWRKGRGLESKSAEAQSPLTAHLTSARAARKTSHDPNAQNGSLAMKALSGLVAERESDSEEENRIIYAIKMEHLERVLEKLADKLRMPVMDELDTFDDDKYMSSKDFGVDHVQVLSPNRDDGCSASSMDSMDLMFAKSPQPKTAHERRDFELKHAENGVGTKPILKYGSEAVNSEPSDRDLCRSQVPTRAAPGVAFAASARSVHFQESPAVEANNGTLSNKVSGLRSRKNLKGLDLQVIDDDDDSDPIAKQLPKTSSYFIASNANPRDETTDTRSSGINIVNRIDYSKLLPPMNGPGIQKWRHLSQQLHLPFPLVMLAVKSRLESYLNTQDNN